MIQRLASIIQLVDGLVNLKDEVIRSKIHSPFSILDRDFDYIATCVGQLMRVGEELGK